MECALFPITDQLKEIFAKTPKRNDFLVKFYNSQRDDPKTWKRIQCKWRKYKKYRDFCEAFPEIAARYYDESDIEKIRKQLERKPEINCQASCPKTNEDLPVNVIVQIKKATQQKKTKQWRNGRNASNKVLLYIA